MLEIQVFPENRIVWIPQLPSGAETIEAFNDLVAEQVSQHYDEQQLLVSRWEEVAGGGFQCRYEDAVFYI